MIWKQWKYGQQPYRQLRQRGVGPGPRCINGGSRRPWRVACRSRLRLPTSTLTDFRGRVLA